jgi:hypothetical protein
VAGLGVGLEDGREDQFFLGMSLDIKFEITDLENLTERTRRTNCGYVVR